MIKAVLFDFDDTLAKTKSIRYSALKEVAKSFYSLEITDKDIDEQWGKPFSTFISGLFRNSDNVVNLTNNYKSVIHKYPQKPFPKTNSVIKTLSKKHKLGIISSSNHSLIIRGLADVKLDPDLFFFIQSAEETNVHKPDPNVFLPSIKKLKAHSIKISEILYVGDAIDDHISASKAGFYFCGIANRTVSEDVFMKSPWVTAISDLCSISNKYSIAFFTLLAKSSVLSLPSTYS